VDDQFREDWKELKDSIRKIALDVSDLKIAQGISSSKLDQHITQHRNAGQSLVGWMMALIGFLALCSSVAIAVLKCDSGM
jgi:hypothetical protein